MSDSFPIEVTDPTSVDQIHQAARRETVEESIVRAKNIIKRHLKRIESLKAKAVKAEAEAASAQGVLEDLLQKSVEEICATETSLPSQEVRYLVVS